MKKVLFVATVLFAFCCTSCKKNYTCVCKSGTTTVATGTIKDTKKKATDACTADNATYASMGSNVTCAIQ